MASASQPGIIARENGVDRVLMASSTFDRVCGGTDAANLVKKHLAKQGLILTTGIGVHRRFAVKRTIAGKGVSSSSTSALLSWPESREYRRPQAAGGPFAALRPLAPGDKLDRQASLTIRFVYFFIAILRL